MEERRKTYSSPRRRWTASEGTIGVFDSGFGGLEVLKSIVNKLPEYKYIYLGDTARTPYGNRSQEVIYNFTKQAVDFLFSKGCELIILACNTASSEALRKIQKQYLSDNFPEKKVLGVLMPTAEKAVEITENNRIGVIGTESTVNSKSFVTEIKKLAPEAKVFQQACPLLVPIVESGEKETKIAELALEKYLTPLIEKDIDTLVLGCTHYGLLEEKIKEITKDRLNLVTEGKIVAEKLKEYLERHPEITNKLNHFSSLEPGNSPKIEFLTTDLVEKFEDLGKEFFGEEISAKKTTLQ